MAGMSPRYCRRAAYECFAERARDLESTGALIAAATAVAMHALDDVHLGVVEERIESLAASVRRNVQSTNRSAVMAHLHTVLFEQEGFAGNRADYYDPANSYLPRVLSSRRGIPITLALVYKAVAERLGLGVRGIGAPGHFLVRVEDEDGALLVDPFHQGRVLSTEEAYRLMEGSLGTAVPRTEELLRPVGHAEWLARLLRNLEAIHSKRAQPRDAAAMQELRLLVER